ncbi:hypothetical protein BH683_008855 [Williamsia sp. 1138]|nr:hypothetical protein BH683_008855 [Williamsia sp. 1138]
MKATGATTMLSLLSRELHLWRLMHLSSNRLIRPYDRLESLIMLLATALAVCSLTIAFMVGSATYANDKQSVLLEQQSRHSVTATILGTAQESREPVSATWTSTDGRSVTGSVESKSADKPGVHRTIWIDQNGTPVDKPRAVGNAVAQAIAVGLTTGLAIVGVWLLLIFSVRTFGDKQRFAAWEAEWQAGAIDSTR